MLLQSNFSLCMLYNVYNVYDVYNVNVYDVYDDSRRYNNAANTPTSDIMKEMVLY